MEDRAQAALAVVGRWHLAALVTALGAAWKQMTERLETAGQDPRVTIEAPPGGRAKLNVFTLGTLGDRSL